MTLARWDYVEVVPAHEPVPTFLSRGAELAANISLSSLALALVVLFAALVAISPKAVEWRRRHFPHHT